MEVPEKIYVEQKAIMYDLVNTEPCKPDDLEYIRKDALIEWIQEVRAIPHDNGITRDLAFQEVVNKLNSM